VEKTLVHWNRLPGDAWADFFAVDLDDAHFNGLEGVYVVWEGGAAPTAIGVGHGLIRDALKNLRADPSVAAYRGKVLFSTWAKVDKASLAGIARYLHAALKPRFGPTPAADAAAIQINLPGRGDQAPPDVPGPAPRQIYEDMLAPDAGTLDDKARQANQAAARAAAAAAAAAAAGRAAAEARAKRAKQVEKLALQTEFTALLAQNKTISKPTGFFGGNGKPVTNEDRLVVDSVHLILLEAVRMRASDIHLEPQDTILRVRYRIDGILEEVLQVSNDLNLRIVSNIRVMCGLDPEKISGGKPEDGRVSVKLEGNEADLRLSTFPTPFGDKAVLRVIPRSTKTTTLDELGLDQRAIDHLRALIYRPQGLIIVTGPTGSGKSTTLYAALHELNDAARNIVTLEDPIERKILGLTQGMIQPKQGFGFAEGLRAILRQDPNVIMVGEMRDQETAEIALSASLTGHLLLSTLHTVSALGAVNRMIDMGLEPFLVASALTAVTAQRLARTICSHCAHAQAPTPEELADIKARISQAGIAMPAGLMAGLKVGKGCEACRGTGYSGRILLFEVCVITPPLREAILRKGGVDELKEAARRGGMEPLLLDGLRKAAEGKTTLAEILRVVDAAD
jgi:type II secretory ATPase GspE/PulE/Tfp pilus assembly ATPase PilB-like protein